jgi:lipopolysaccharide export system ATP-binding protein
MSEGKLNLDQAQENIQEQQERVSTLRVVSIAKRYGLKKIIKNVSLEVNQGEVIGLLGPNGAGKTTCFYSIVGLVPVDSGRIYLKDQDLTYEPIHRRSALGLAYLPQEASIFKKLSVADNIRAVLELRFQEKGHRFLVSQVEERTQQLLQELQISHIAGSLGSALSGGERRRVEIARALALEPDFMLLDEPFAGVDPIAVIEIQRIIRFLKIKGMGVLITDHNVRETLGVCDRAYIISEGVVLASGTPNQLVENADVRRVYLGEQFRL